mmetsp:Transcript_26640/g.56090  ORF Transcript_26640/g.56090 Transcript_26640/m.56090 type:complete len:287 (+) Transcript_26640:94-954(+)
MNQFWDQPEAKFKDGCLAVRQSVLEKQKVGLSPGPIYNPNLSASSTSKVDCRDIRFVSGPPRFGDVSENKRKMKVFNTQHPGPQTYCPDAIRRAIFHHQQRNPPSFKFGEDERECNKNRSSTNVIPSPAEYDPDSIRRGISFSKKGSPSITFGQAKPIEEKQCTKPGPQTYDPDMIRKGIMSTKSSMPSVKFGSPPKKKSPDSMLVHNPGPQEYDTDSIRKGVYSLSTKKRPAGVKFTTGKRSYNDIEERERASKPGPCSYVIPSSLGTQSNSKYRSQPSISFGAR